MARLIHYIISKKSAADDNDTVRDTDNTPESETRNIKVCPTPTFEEYLKSAADTRVTEKREEPVGNYEPFGPKRRRFQWSMLPNPRSLMNRRSESATKYDEALHENGRGEGQKQREQDSVPVDPESREKTHPSEEKLPDQGRIPITDEEWSRTSRAVRTASWSAVFYLLTMDILGPFSAPWAFAALGYGPSVIIYTVLSGLATYGGFMLWKMFLGLDSYQYPVKTYADLAFRIYGPIARHVVTGLQSTQLLFNVGIIILINGLSLEQIIVGAGRKAVCFVVLCLVWALAGMIFGNIRTLRRLAWVANFAIWINAFSIIAIMGVVARSGVLTEAAQKANVSFHIIPNEPITTSAGLRAGLPFTGAVIAVMAAVYSFGGAILFVEFLGEMRRPMDFWKALVCAEAFIYCLYLAFGLFVYSRQGQYTINPTYQGLSPYAWHAAISSLQLVTSCVATLLYANIGLKVIFNNILVGLLRLPDLSTARGKVLWAAFVPAYWSLAFVIATAIPQVSNLGGLIASACVLQFSFTFPPLLMVGYNVRRDGASAGAAMVSDAGTQGPGSSSTTTTTTTTHGGGQTSEERGWRWIWKGYRTKLVWNLFNTMLGLAGFTLAILGIYSSSYQIKQSYGAGASTSFSCANPYGST